MRKIISRGLILILWGLWPMTLLAQDNCPFCENYQVLIKELVTIMRKHNLNMSKEHQAYIEQQPNNQEQGLVDSLRSELERINVFRIKYVTELLLQEKPYLTRNLSEIAIDTLSDMRTRSEEMAACDERVEEFYKNINRMIELKSGYDSICNTINRKYDKEGVRASLACTQSLLNLCVEENHKQEIQHVAKCLDQYEWAIIAFRNVIKRIQTDRTDDAGVVKDRLTRLFENTTTKNTEDKYIFLIPYMKDLYLSYKENLLAFPLGNESTQAVEAKVLDLYDKLD